MTYKVLLIGMSEVPVDTTGLDIKLDRTTWDFYHTAPKI